MIGVRLGPGTKVREFPVSDTVLFFHFISFSPSPADSPCHWSSFFSGLFRKNAESVNGPYERREQRAAWFPSALCFPSTSASRTLHQQKSGHLGSENNSRETWITPRCLRYMLRAITGETGRLGKREN